MCLGSISFCFFVHHVESLLHVRPKKQVRHNTVAINAMRAQNQTIIKDGNTRTKVSIPSCCAIVGSRDVVEVEGRNLYKEVDEGCAVNITRGVSMPKKGARPELDLTRMRKTTKAKMKDWHY